ncbi:MAG TPA: VWA domain-containing protein, partial [Acidimicrobiales bacterium]|nr:VWA domain-containing protein [Acidimicrobiales bacterium]
DEVIDLACAVALEVGAEGLRADLMLCRAAAAHAAWRGVEAAGEEDLRAVAPLVLGHRRRRSPLDPPGIPPEELEQAFDQAIGDVGDGPEGPTGPDGDPVDEAPARPPGGAVAPPTIQGTRARDRAAPGRRGAGGADRGRFVRAAEATPDQPVTPGTVAVVATAVATASRRASATDPIDGIEASDLRRAVREQRTGALVIVCVDASGSMGADRRIELAKGAVLGLLADAYQRRDRVALVTFGGGGAQVVLRPTASIEIAKARLVDLPTGGTSPIAEGLDAARRLATGGSGDHGLEPLVVLLTDGRATGSEDALARSRASAADLAAAGIDTVVIDAESGPTRLGLAAELAEAAAAPCLALDALVDGSLERTIRLRLR